MMSRPTFSSEDVAYVPGSTREASHLSHRLVKPASCAPRTPTRDALACAALRQARAVLASHKGTTRTVDSSAPHS
jgi:hypothetical protein